MTVAKKRFLLVVILIGGTFSLYVLLASTRAKKMAGLSQHLALECAGLAALEYLDDQGELPRSVGELIEHSYITRSEDGKFAEYAARPTATPRWQDLIQVHLCFPADLADCSARDGRIVDDATGAERFFVVVPVGVRQGVDLRNATLFLWNRWSEMRLPTQASK